MRDSGSADRPSRPGFLADRGPGVQPATGVIGPAGAVQAGGQRPGGPQRARRAHDTAQFANQRALVQVAQAEVCRLQRALHAAGARRQPQVSEQRQAGSRPGRRFRWVSTASRSTAATIPACSASASAAWPPLAEVCAAAARYFALFAADTRSADAAYERHRACRARSRSGLDARHATQPSYVCRWRSRRHEASTRKVSAPSRRYLCR